MIPEWLLRYVHFISLLIMAATLFAEWILLESKLTRAAISRLARIDLAYGIASLTAVAAGLTMWLDNSGKGAEFYSQNPVFWTKLAVVSAVGLISLPPTFFFLKHRKGDTGDTVTVPPVIRNAVRAELLLFVLVPLLATMMAWGIGH